MADGPRLHGLHSIYIVFAGTGRRTLTKKRSVADGMIDPDRDLYAIPSQDGNDIYFLSLVDILTHYGNSHEKYFI